MTQGNYPRLIAEEGQGEGGQQRDPASSFSLAHKNQHRDDICHFISVLRHRATLIVRIVRTNYPNCPCIRNHAGGY